MPDYDLICGDCLDVMERSPAEYFHSIVTDPPYGLSFMGKDWDHGVPGEHFWREALRVAKPGAHLLAFGGTRTFHRLTCSIEDAGWEIRDCLMWLYGSGFPKSLNVSSAIDKAARGCPQGSTKGDPLKRGVGKIPDRNALMRGGADGGSITGLTSEYGDYEPTTDAAKKWSGWGTALKPAWEPIILARKPLDGTVAENVQEHGTGALNVDGCRIGHNEDCRMMAPSQANIDSPSEKHRQAGRRKAVLELKPSGRWPANLLLDEEAAALLPDAKGQQGDLIGHSKDRLSKGVYGDMKAARNAIARQDSGSAARFFYCAKTSRAERGEGNNHPTVKPQALMRYLAKLVTPPAGVVLDPFCGSGSTGIAALVEGFDFVGIEKEPQYVEIARKRIEACLTTT